MATAKELIQALLDCDLLDDVYVNIIDENGKNNFYKIDGLENSFYEYRKKPTFCIVGDKLNVE